HISTIYITNGQYGSSWNFQSWRTSDDTGCQRNRTTPPCPHRTNMLAMVGEAKQKILSSC
ncbi:MAG: hypothetical protein OXM00_05490, partial [Paracoccaceae bacterium]|nr:hypothetical protein [Paracoccaceae bacterium]